MWVSLKRTDPIVIDCPFTMLLMKAEGRRWKIDENKFEGGFHAQIQRRGINFVSGAEESKLDGGLNARHKGEENKRKEMEIKAFQKYK